MIDRKVDPGQTVAAQFQTPVMFVVAPDLEKKVHVYASVDEADIGLIREAQDRNEPVTLHRGRLPQGRLRRARSPRCGSTRPRSQNVVTYTVVVESANAG